MTTETSPLNRQPTKLDYSSPTQFRFLINQLPKVQYFTVSNYKLEYIFGRCSALEQH